MAQIQSISLDDEASGILKAIAVGEKSEFVCRAIKAQAKKEAIRAEAAVESPDELKARHEKEKAEAKAHEAQLKEKNAAQEKETKLFQHWKGKFIDALNAKQFATKANSAELSEAVERVKRDALKAGVVLKIERSGRSSNITASSTS